uniref:F-box domain-containing protein n=1 Tax=Oryza punctata TaxID=4537 RepID=A0A0E0L9N1_ORYPU
MGDGRQGEGRRRGVGRQLRWRKGVCEKLLRIPPQPGSLLPASLVYKSWRRHVADHGFLHRFLGYRHGLMLLLDRPRIRSLFVPDNVGLLASTHVDISQPVGWPSDQGNHLLCCQQSKCTKVVA